MAAVIEPCPEDRSMDQFAMATTAHVASWDIIKYCGEDVGAYPSKDATDTVVAAVDGKELLLGGVGDSIVIAIIGGGQHNCCNEQVVVLADDELPGYSHGVAEVITDVVDCEDVEGA